MNKESKIYVAGHMGFVGKNVIKHLENNGYENLIFKTRNELNLENYEDVDYLFYKEKPEFVIDCAAKVGGINANMSDQYNFLLKNLIIQNNILDNCVKHKSVKKCVFLGSSCIYPDLNGKLLSEEDMLQGNFEETNEGYALAKVTGLKLVEYANKQFKNNCKFITLIPPNLCGMGDSFNLKTCHVFTALIKKMVDAKRSNIENVVLWGSGKPRREFLDVRDLCDCILWSLENLDYTKTFLNVGKGFDISINNLAYMIKNETEFGGEIVFDTSKPDGIFSKCMNVSKINELGWKFKINLEDSIRNVIKEYEGV